MKLFRKKEMQRLEEAAARSGASLWTLMEGAGRALRETVRENGGPEHGKAVLLCGAGNNGGDGFVCARLLAEAGMSCTVLLVQGEPRTELSRRAFSQLPGSVATFRAESQPQEAEGAIEEADVLLDCVFGFGFRGELSRAAARYLSLAGQQTCLKLAADLPSGVECDTGRADPGAFRADVTVAFTGKKPAHASYPAKEYCGKVEVRQVGVPLALLEGAETGFFETDADFSKVCLKEPDPQSNKGDLGKLLLVCGSPGMAGACVMAARAALRCGVGLVRVAVEKSIYPIVAQAVPEAVFLLLDLEGRRQESLGALSNALDACTACLMGCGLGGLAELLCPVVLERCKAPLVLDAGALNFCARHPGVLEGLEAPAILTPHPGEMARLCQDAIPEIQADRLGAAREKARETGAVVALKGAATVVAAPDGRCAVNPTGNPGMAKGGSGDVLAGMVASLAAQGVPVFEAAAAGAYLHGLAGDLCAERRGQRAMLPTDMISVLSEIFQDLV